MKFIMMQRIWTKPQIKAAVLRAFEEELGFTPKRNQITISDTYHIVWINMNDGSHRTYYIEYEYNEYHDAICLKVYKTVIDNNEEKRTLILKSYPFLQVPNDKKA